MPEAQSTVCDRLPDGFVHVMQVEGLMPNRFAYSWFTRMDSSRKRCNTPAFRTAGQSHWPVMETPKRRSASQCSFHSLERYLKSVSVDWYVPRMAATLIFRIREPSVSSARAI